MTIRIGIAGVMGRMGQALVGEVLAQGSRAALAGGSERPGHPALGQPIRDPASHADSGCTVTSDIAALFAAADVVIDFSSPQALPIHLDAAAASGTALFVGTTGLTPDHLAAIDATAAKVPVLQTANASLGVNLLASLVRQAAARLDGAVWDIEIVEMHHRHKVDAPSGTALLLGRAAAQGRNARFEDVAVLARQGITGARAQGAIGFAALRGGNVAGEHSVIFAAEDERLELTHKATDRRIFARGAVRAALWLAARPPGRYAMADVLEL